MAPKLFILGATGYVGGDALVEILSIHPDWEVTCLARNKERAAALTERFPQVKVVHGDLDSSSLIEEEASLADIVYNFANCDHEASAQAIVAGLARRTSENPAFLIHTSGTGILLWKGRREGSFGEDDAKIYDDWEGLSELTSLPDDAVHRNVDKIVLAASNAHPNKIKTAIVCPPTIYGTGRGPGNTKSIQIELAIKTFLESRKAFSVGRGLNVWHGIYVQDLSKLYVLLGEAAANGGSPATWNDQGYYLAENGNFVWRDVFEAIAQAANKRGLLPSAELEMRKPEELDRMYAHIVGLTSRGVSKRGAVLLGWKPTGPTIFEQVPELVEREAKTLGLI